MWYLYILKCSDFSLYTGVTSDIDKRIKEYNSKKGGSYTRIRISVELIYKEQYGSKSQALKREAQLKGWTKKKKIALINGNKFKLRELSRSND